MRELSVEEKYKNFKHTLNECNSKVLLENDEVIEYNILEEFSIDCYIFINEYVLNIFLDNEIIDKNIFDKSINLRNEYINLEKKYPELMNIESIKNSQMWERIFKLSDEIIELISEKERLL